MADNKRTYTIYAEIPDAEIRAVKDKTVTINDKEYHHIELACDTGNDLNRVYLKDKNMENINKYKRGMTGTFSIRIDIEEGFKGKTNITVTDFKEVR